MAGKIVSADEAVALLRDGDLLATSGFVGIGTPDELLAAVEQRFLAGNGPARLSLLFAAGQGDGRDRGLNRLAHAGLVARAIGGHWGLVPKLGRLALEGRIAAYNLPQGCISQLYRDIAAGKPGNLSRVGLGAFVDPRLQGGKINRATTEELVEILHLAGRDWLFYKALPIDVAFIRGTTADLDGNISMEREALTLDNLAMAMAARNSGGLVIAQVERLAERGTLAARQVRVPGVLVDAVVLARPENHPQTYATDYSPAFAGEIRVPLDQLPPLPLDERKVIARRAAMELMANSVVNLGIGMPEGIASVANEEGILKYLTLTAEPGVIGGLPASGLDFGAAINCAAIVEQNQQFDYYDGGGLDLACLGMAECDGAGNVNVSRFGSRLAGCGGFINISQNARQVLFVGTFMAGGLHVRAADGQVAILHEGRQRKFVKEVEQVTFSGPLAAQGAQQVRYITERCVFRLTGRGLELIEIAPGLELERDILRHMAFTPLVDGPRPMHPAIFEDRPLDLKRLLLGIALLERVSYDKAQDTLFLNFGGLRVNHAADVAAIRKAVEERCRKIGHKVWAVVNYDGFEIADDAVAAYADMANAMSEHYYSGVSRYANSAFLRMKLGAALASRGRSPHIYESADEARRSLGGRKKGKS
ncbi:MAG: acyl CoA:acetate/3-ketoacid CoA transferase [Alphaproteobacteria bacterium]|nr:acyl CoA:acetate/3-ketoacid CoA transferase [Alphaproteobacteria bacterium]